MARNRAGPGRAPARRGSGGEQPGLDRRVGPLDRQRPAEPGLVGPPHMVVDRARWPPRATAWWDSPCRPQFPAADLGPPAAFRWWGLNGSSVVCRCRDHHRRRTSVFSALAEVRRSGGYLVLEPGEDRRTALDRYPTNPSRSRVRVRRVETPPPEVFGSVGPRTPLGAGAEEARSEGIGREREARTGGIDGNEIADVDSSRAAVRRISRAPAEQVPASAKRVSFSRRPHDQRGRVPPAGRAETQRRRRWRRPWPRAPRFAAGFP